MSLVAWWILAGSVGVALIIMVVAFVVMRKRINKIKNEYLKTMSEHEKQNIAIAFDRDNYGKILHEHKPTDKEFADDVDMEYAFNTIVRNAYKSISIWNFDSEYEKKSFEQITKNKVVDHDHKYDFALANTNGRIYEKIKDIYANLNPKGMIFVVNAPKKSKEIKTLRYDLKMLGYRHEWQDLSKGIILIAK